jgi:Lipid A core - O-antigen ligase and related enzymes
MYGLGKLKNNEIGQYSDSKRLLSIIVGWELFKQNPIFGVGAGDLVLSVQDMYSQKYSDVAVESRLLPHNQFLRVVNSVGIIGLIAFLSFFIYPLFNKDIISNPLLAAFIFSALASFCVEGTIENQIGTAYFIVFYFTFYKNTSFRLI